MTKLTEQKQQQRQFSEELMRWMTILTAALERRQLSQQEIEARNAAYLGSSLRNLSVEELNRACSRCLDECKFFPSIAEIRERAPGSLVDAEALEAEREWETVLGHVNRWGETVYPEDPKLVLSGAGEYAFRRIGWRAGLLNTVPENLHWAHKEFVEAYTTHAKTGGLLAPGREEARLLLERTQRLALPEGAGQVTA